MRARSREFGLRLGTLELGPGNTIADVGEVRVGHVTLISGEGKLVPGKGPVRTGVTVIVPHRGNVWRQRPKANWDTINGAGELTSAVAMREFGLIETPIALTNTLCVGNAAMGLIEATLEANPEVGAEADTFIPTVSECDDSDLNDARGLHVKPHHVKEALDGASADVTMGTVGAGTGMTCCQYKGGIGSASRRLGAKDGGWTVGSLVLSNFGWREHLTIAGVPVGRELMKLDKGTMPKGGGASIVTVLATDAPLSSRQLGRLARRAFHGIARLGSFSGSGSGDIAIAFSTAQWVPYDAAPEVLEEKRLHDSLMNPLLLAAVESTEEAIVDSLFTATTVVGRDDHRVPELPIPQTVEILDRYGRITG
ncbi:MAG TPA: P1 family peptidase [Thermoplasmata archaeon]|nr:P1 family peptidase [Thermoplasmata archaeon]